MRLSLRVGGGELGGGLVVTVRVRVRGTVGSVRPNASVNEWIEGLSLDCQTAYDGRVRVPLTSVSDLVCGCVNPWKDTPLV